MWDLTELVSAGSSAGAAEITEESRMDCPARSSDEAKIHLDKNLRALEFPVTII
jgi:hypothetical protein